MSEIYDSEIVCENCKRLNKIKNIPKGTRVNKIVISKELKCLECGCHLIYHPMLYKK